MTAYWIEMRSPATMILRMDCQRPDGVREKGGVGREVRNAEKGAEAWRREGAPIFKYQKAIPCPRKISHRVPPYTN